MRSGQLYHADIDFICVNHCTSELHVAVLNSPECPKFSTVSELRQTQFSFDKLGYLTEEGADISVTVDRA